MKNVLKFLKFLRSLLVLPVIFYIKNSTAQKFCSEFAEIHETKDDFMGIYLMYISIKYRTNVYLVHHYNCGSEYTSCFVKNEELAKKIKTECSYYSFYSKKKEKQNKAASFLF